MKKQTLKQVIKTGAITGILMFFIERTPHLIELIGLEMYMAFLGNLAGYTIGGIILYAGLYYTLFHRRASEE